MRKVVEPLSANYRTIPVFCFESWGMVVPNKYYPSHLWYSDDKAWSEAEAWTKYDNLWKGQQAVCLYANEWRKELVWAQLHIVPPRLSRDTDHARDSRVSRALAPPHTHVLMTGDAHSTLLPNYRALDGRATKATLKWTVSNNNKNKEVDPIFCTS